MAKPPVLSLNRLNLTNGKARGIEPPGGAAVMYVRLYFHNSGGDPL